MTSETKNFIQPMFSMQFNYCNLNPVLQYEFKDKLTRQVTQCVSRYNSLRLKKDYLGRVSNRVYWEKHFIELFILNVLVTPKVNTCSELLSLHGTIPVPVRGELNKHGKEPILRMPSGVSYLIACPFIFNRHRHCFFICALKFKISIVNETRVVLLERCNLQHSRSRLASGIVSDGNSHRVRRSH